MGWGKFETKPKGKTCKVDHRVTSKSLEYRWCFDYSQGWDDVLKENFKEKHIYILGLKIFFSWPKKARIWWVRVAVKAQYFPLNGVHCGLMDNLRHVRISFWVNSHKFLFQNIKMIRKHVPVIKKIFRAVVLWVLVKWKSTRWLSSHHVCPHLPYTPYSSCLHDGWLKKNFKPKICAFLQNSHLKHYFISWNRGKTLT